MAVMAAASAWCAAAGTAARRPTVRRISGPGRLSGILRAALRQPEVRRGERAARVRAGTIRAAVGLPRPRPAGAGGGRDRANGGGSAIRTAARPGCTSADDRRPAHDHGAPGRQPWPMRRSPADGARAVGLSELRAPWPTLDRCTGRLVQGEGRRRDRLGARTGRCGASPPSAAMSLSAIARMSRRLLGPVARWTQTIGQRPSYSPTKSCWPAPAARCSGRATPSCRRRRC